MSQPLQRPQASLISSTDPSQRFPIERGQFVIGRSPSCDVVLSDPRVSRRHAVLTWQAGVFWLENLSRNPVHINDALVQKAALKDGDQLQLGQTKLRFVLAPQEASVPASRPNEDRTAMAPSLRKADSGPRLRISRSSAPSAIYPLTGQPLTIGRDDNCDIHIPSDMVSRCHARLFWDQQRWCIQDLKSRNGTHLNGQPIETAHLPPKATLQFGVEGPVLLLEFLDVPAEQLERVDSTEKIANRYFGDAKGTPLGEHTMMVRKVFQQVRKRHSRRYWIAISAVATLLMLSLATVVYQQIKLQQARQLAIEIFYNMKSLDLQITQIEDLLREKAEVDFLTQMQSKREEFKAMKTQYDQLVEDLDVMQGLSPEDRAILNMARIFGECEVNVPEGFAQKVKEYIQKWRSTQRLKQAIARIEANGYATVVRQQMEANDLAPQFMYLALKESYFNPKAVGPSTRYGFAKGIWQFIPATAQEYGLKVGPLVHLPKYDPLDQRFDFEAATAAAARFLRNIYKTDAQASGLLVMASYNWGPGNIRSRIRKMPENPRQRNFWELLKQHRIPKETYDYVFYIFSAATIGENPHLFGFNFRNPLE